MFSEGPTLLLVSQPWTPLFTLLDIKYAHHHCYHSHCHDHRHHGHRHHGHRHHGHRHHDDTSSRWLVTTSTLGVGTWAETRSTMTGAATRQNPQHNYKENSAVNKPRRMQRKLWLCFLFITGPEKIHLRQSELNPNGMSWSPPHPTEKSQHRLTQPSNSHSISPNFPRFGFFRREN